MNSFCNYAFGTVCQWMFDSLAGIDTGDAGYGHIVLRPGPPSANSNPDHEPIDWVKAEYDSIRGKIAVEWKQNPGSFEYKVTIPANTRATLYLPASSAASVTESGTELDTANGVTLPWGGSGARSTGARIGDLSLCRKKMTSHPGKDQGTHRDYQCPDRRSLRGIVSDASRPGLRAFTVTMRNNGDISRKRVR